MQVTKSDVMSTINEQWESMLKDSGSDAQASQQQLQAYLSELEPNVEQAIMEQSTFALGFFEDALAGRIARIGINFIQQRQDAFVQSAVAILRLAIKVAIA